MITLDHPVIIVGGGLAGLTAARRLHRAGIGFRLFEARDRLGGRILSAGVNGEPSTDGFDLGPSWFWPGMQPAMADIVQELQLEFFPQNSDGDVVFQRMSREAVQRYRGMQQEPQSMRLSGGTGAIVEALAAGLPRESITLGAQVTHVLLEGEDVVVRFADAGEMEKQLRGAHVLFALPPRLLEQKVQFTPPLDVSTSERWRQTPTWMAPHAKFFAIYDHPFWREAGLSGSAQSMVGPLVEVHDATTASGKAALFGFVGVPALQRAAAGRDAIVAAAVEQLAQLFGVQAKTPRATLFKDWAADPLTATSQDQVGGDHPSVDSRPWVTGRWQDHITLAGSETSLTEPGYLAGAVEAGERSAHQIITNIKTRQHRLAAVSTEQR